jgi:hypothetical protein
MKKIMTAVVLGMIVQAAVAAPILEKTTTTSLDQPVPQEYYQRFVACQRTDRPGFYWLDSINGHLWQFDRSRTEWEDQDIQEGMEPGIKGTYMLLTDNRNGVYVLNSRTGQGWWFTDSKWEAIDKDAENPENPKNQKASTL